MRHAERRSLPSFSVLPHGPRPYLQAQAQLLLVLEALSQVHAVRMEGDGVLHGLLMPLAESGHQLPMGEEHKEEDREESCHRHHWSMRTDECAPERPRVRMLESREAYGRCVFRHTSPRCADRAVGQKAMLLARGVMRCIKIAGSPSRLALQAARNGVVSVAPPLRRLRTSSTCFAAVQV